jgi:hypothetical protein
MNYVLYILGLVFVGIGLISVVDAANIRDNIEVIFAQLAVGFGVLSIGLGALIGVAKHGFARLEKQLSSGTQTTDLSEQPASSQQD